MLLTTAQGPAELMSPFGQYGKEFVDIFQVLFHLFAISGGVDKRLSVHGEFFTWSYVGYVMGYAALYITIMLVATVLRYRRRDFV